jgi:hypothetical protein
MKQPSAICSIEGCKAGANAKGLCAKHYMRARRHGDPSQVKPRGAPKNAWKAKLRGMIDPATMSTRTFDRYCATIGKLARVGATPEALQEIMAKATRPNGSFNVSKFAAFTESVLREVERERRGRLMGGHPHE